MTDDYAGYGEILENLTAENERLREKLEDREDYIGYLRLMLQESLGWMEGVELRPSEEFLKVVRVAVARDRSSEGEPR